MQVHICMYTCRPYTATYTANLINRTVQPFTALLNRLYTFYPNGLKLPRCSPILWELLQHYLFQLLHLSTWKSWQCGGPQRSAQPTLHPLQRQNVMPAFGQVCQPSIHLSAFCICLARTCSTLTVSRLIAEDGSSFSWGTVAIGSGCDSGGITLSRTGLDTWCLAWYSALMF